MKRICFLSSVLIFFCVATVFCQQVTDTTVLGDYFNNPFIKKYQHFKGLISPDSAKIFIDAYPKHVYRGLRKKRLKNAWSEFDQNLSKQISNDSEVEEVVFLLAAFPKKKKFKNLKGRPFVMMKVITREIAISSPPTALNSHFILRKALELYFIPKVICPPPDAGCVVPGL